MNLSLTDRINRIEPSGTVQLTAILQDLRHRGVDVIDMAVGEPDFAVHPAIVTATSKALAKGLTRYGPVGGLPELRLRIADDFEGCAANNIIVTNGAKQALYMLFQVLCEKGAEVIIPTPCWVSFSHQVKLAGGRPMLVPTCSHQLDIEAIEKAIGPRTVAVLINSPNNPTGAVYPPAVIGAVGQICREKGIWLISDEAYQAFDLDRDDGFSPFHVGSLRERLIVVHSFSKTYGMTGFRVGYALAPAPVIEALSRLQSHLSGNVCTFAQHGALTALDLPDEIIQAQRRQYQRKRDRAFELTGALFDCCRPTGAFYLLPSIERYAARFQSGIAMAAWLLEKARVTVVPGEHFFAPGHLRISFAVDGISMEEGFQRMREVLTT
jgi:aspartate aminotransferase